MGCPQPLPVDQFFFDVVGQPRHDAVAVIVVHAENSSTIAAYGVPAASRVCTDAVQLPALAHRQRCSNPAHLAMLALVMIGLWVFRVAGAPVVLVSFAPTTGTTAGVRMEYP